MTMQQIPQARVHDGSRRPRTVAGRRAPVRAVRQELAAAGAGGRSALAPRLVEHEGPGDLWTIGCGAVLGAFVGAGAGATVAATTGAGVLPAVLLGLVVGACVGLLLLAWWLAYRHPDEDGSRRWSA